LKPSDKIKARGNSATQTKPMDETRRIFIKRATSLSLISLAATAGLISPNLAKAAAFKSPFDATNIDDALSSLSAGVTIENSDKIELKVPKVAENGALVPITVSSSLNNVKSIAVFAEKNPQPLVARFELGEYTNPVVGARIKMAKTSQISVILSAENRLYTTRKLVNVTVGGCG